MRSGARPIDQPVQETLQGHGQETAPDVGMAMSRRDRLAVAGVVAVTLLLVGIGFALSLPTLRAVSVSVFLLVEIGAAPVLLTKPRPWAWFVLFAATASLVITVLLGFAMAVLHLWHPFIVFGACAVVTVVLLGLSVIRDARHRSS